MELRKKHQKTLEAVFARPIRASVPWSAVESLLRALGAEIERGDGSRVRVTLNGEREYLHLPHGKDTDKGALNTVMDFLTRAGVKP